MNTFDLSTLIFDFTLVTHIIAGAVVLLTGLLAMILHKGGKNHRQLGKVYFWSMAYVSLSTGVLVLFHPNRFMLLLAVLIFYQTFTGYRVLLRKRLTAGSGPTWLDWAMGLLCTLAGLLFAGWVLLALFGWRESAAPPSFILITSVIGFYAFWTGAMDLRTFARPPQGDKNHWWYHHMGSMVGSYTGAIIAFTNTNVAKLLPPELVWTVWLIPGVLGIAGGIIWINHYKKKFNRVRTPRPLPQVVVETEVG
ncbi:MAG: hypothetical protein H0T73_14790 [Ardenticatenales bacterium]|nr:hypothetical protein [Ardenticatenales bacterium]